MTPEQGAMLRADAPETIYLQTGDEDDCNADHPLEFDSDQVTWCQDQQYDSDIKYVRADLFTAALSRAEAAEAKLAESQTAHKASDAEVDRLIEEVQSWQHDWDEAIAKLEAAEARAGRLATTARAYFARSTLNTGQHRHLIEDLRAALADAPSNWLRDRLREEREPLVAALKKIRTSWAGYAITKSEKYPEVLSEMWQEVKRMDEIASSTIRALPESE